MRSIYVTIAGVALAGVPAILAAQGPAPHPTAPTRVHAQAPVLSNRLSGHTGAATPMPGRSVYSGGTKAGSSIGQAHGGTVHQSPTKPGMTPWSVGQHSRSSGPVGLSGAVRSPHSSGPPSLDGATVHRRR